METNTYKPTLQDIQKVINFSKQLRYHPLYINTFTTWIELFETGKTELSFELWLLTSSDEMRQAFFDDYTTPPTVDLLINLDMIFNYKSINWDDNDPIDKRAKHIIFALENSLTNWLSGLNEGEDITTPVVSESINLLCRQLNGVIEFYFAHKEQQVASEEQETQEKENE